LFTDLVGSTRLWEEFPDAMRRALARHDELVRTAIEDTGGLVVKTTGDGFHAVFPTARGAVDAAVALQLALAAETFAETGPLQVRVGVHTCEAEYRDGDYYGSEVNRAARLMSVAHGGQVVVSLATSALVRDGSVELVDLGDHRLRDLTTAERVYEVRAPGLATGHPPLRSLDALPGNLPRQMTTFVGRDAEIASIAALLREASLVTLTGVGGVGKTRLSLQVAAEVVPHFPDGAWLCEFAPLADPGAVWETMAGSLGLQPFPGRSLEETVLEYLSSKRMLLVVDNCEHLLDALARVIETIARRAPQVSVLATSREGLGLPGERMVAVPSLGLPADDLDVDELVQTDSVRLFAARAESTGGFVLTPQNASAVGVVCRRLDGIPLAIELAAARARSMSADDLVDRLDQRFKLLTRGSRSARERQQTLRSTIDWSYDLLDPTEQLALNRLSVFAGSCDLAGAEAVLADDDLDEFDVVDLLGQLVDKSLVVAEHHEERVRYRMLETIRQYADEKLREGGETEAVRRRHADHYVARVEEAGPHLVGPDQVAWNASLMRDADNLRATLDWAIETPSVEHALRLVVPLMIDTSIGDLALEWAPLATNVPGADSHPGFPAVAAWAAWAAARSVDVERAQHFLDRGDCAARELGVRSLELARARSLIDFGRGDYVEALRHATEWLELSRAAGDPEPYARALVLSGAMLCQRGDIESGFASIDEAIVISRQHGQLANLAYGLMSKASYVGSDAASSALAGLDEAVVIAEHLGGFLLVNCLWGQGWCRATIGDWAGALAAMIESLDAQRRFHTPLAGGYVASVACTFTALGHHEPAAVLFGFADTLFVGMSAVSMQNDLVDTARAELAAAFDADALAALKDRGAALSSTEALAYLRAEAEGLLGAELRP
jgi:predicted ATPase